MPGTLRLKNHVSENERLPRMSWDFSGSIVVSGKSPTDVLFRLANAIERHRGKVQTADNHSLTFGNRVIFGRGWPGQLPFGVSKGALYLTSNGCDRYRVSYRVSMRAIRINLGVLVLLAPSPIHNPFVRHAPTLTEYFVKACLAILVYAIIRSITQHRFRGFILRYAPNNSA